jgi:hypothetical protein
MNPWLRVLAAFGLAIAAALFLKVLPPLIGSVRDRSHRTGGQGGGSAATRCVDGGRRGIARVAADPSTG